MRLSARTVTVALKAPLSAAHGVISERELVLVTLTADDGLTGHGEAAPLPSYDGVTLAAVQRALDDCRAVLADYPGHAPVADVMARCAEATVLAPALAAVDLALWDLAGRRAGEPVWRLLGASEPRPVLVNHTLVAADRSGAALEAAEAREAGYTTIKVKVGIGDDAGRLAAVRAFGGPGMAVRIDANGAWAPAEALANLTALEATGLELCEEPTPGVEGIRALSAACEIPLALDESAADPLALEAPPAAALVCLKISRCGGVSGVLTAAERARVAGYEVFLASTLDGPLGVAAALHAAAVIRPARACGLATLGAFVGRNDPLPVSGGAIAPPQAPGLGDPALRAWYGI